MPTNDQPVLTVRELTVKNIKCFATATLSNLKRITILIGPNNAGKSALLVGLRRLTRLGRECLPIVGSPDGLGLTADLHTFRTRPGDITDDQTYGELHFRLDISDATNLFLEEPFPVSGSPGPLTVELAVTIGLITQGKWPTISIIMPADSLAELISRFDSFLLPNNRPDISGSNCTHFGIRIATALAKQIIYVPNEREILRSLDLDQYGNYEERRFSGRDSIRTLTQWHLKGERARIEAVQSFVSKVLNARIEIRTTLDPSLEVNINQGTWRDLTQVGSGVAHLIVIAIATQSVANPILLLEEPELSLHPRLQRRLLPALAEFSHQTLITTHSNHILDSMDPEVQLFRVTRREGTKAIVQPVGRKVLETLHDIGARPGSLAEANTVLWVEGPSDAVYLRHWLLIYGSHLAEGIDFVFAFHAGALLFHSSDERSSESLSVFGEINPNYFLVLDQDPNDEGEPVHSYTQRWIGHERAWITQPKEIEGYISDSALCAALGTFEASSVSDTSKSLRERLIALGLPRSWSKRKVQLATSVVALANSGINVIHGDHRDNLDANVRRIVRFVGQSRADDPLQEVSR